MIFVIYAIHVSILILHHGSLSEGLACLECDHVVKPSDCRTANRCKDQELCSIRKYVSNDGHEWFDLGCSSSQRCIPITSIPVVGKRNVLTKTFSKFEKEARSEKPSKTVRSTTETVVCEKCCIGDNCNGGLLCDTLDCDPNPCIHGVCKSSLQGYSCTCHQGYDGSICDKIINYCDPNPCIHGVCKSSLQGYHCTCQYGYDGSKCDKLKDFCNPNLCIHGVCKSSLLGYSCKCQNGYEGTNCEKLFDYCDPNPCVHGVCKSSLQGYSCTCESGYQGSKCDKFTVDHCDPNPCMHGVCHNSLQGYSCKCHHEYEGTNCDKYCDPNPCSNMTCKQFALTYSCTCMAGYLRYKKDKANCNPDPCIHGTCQSNIHGYFCTCNEGYTGTNCDAENKRQVVKRLFTSQSQYNWKWSDCSDPNTRRISFTNFDVSPKPIHVPGNVNIHMNSNIANEHPVDSCENYRLNVTMDKKLLSNWHVIPCKKPFGSCFYDLCGFLKIFADHLCPPVKSLHSLPTTCACSFGKVNFQSTLKWKPNPSYGFLLNGDFRARVEILKGHSIVGCLRAEWSITIPCHGFLCGGR